MEKLNNESSLHNTSQMTKNLLQKNKQQMQGVSTVGVLGNKVAFFCSRITSKYKDAELFGMLNTLYCTLIRLW